MGKRLTLAKDDVIKASNVALIMTLNSSCTNNPTGNDIVRFSAICAASVDFLCLVVQPICCVISLHALMVGHIPYDMYTVREGPLLNFVNGAAS